jgi:hypothetical protein
MATIATQLNSGSGFTSGETVTANKLNDLVNTATVTNIQTADIANSAVTDAKLAAPNRAPLSAAINSQTANYTLALADSGGLVTVSNASNLTVTIPTNASVAFPTGTQIIVTRFGAGEVSLAGASGVTLNSSDSKKRLNKQYSAASLIKTDTNAWLAAGDLKV